MTSLYQLDSVAQVYAGKQVLFVDQLSVELGEVLCLVGPTGAGKSTLLRLLAGVETPESGSLVYRGRPIPAGGLTLAEQRRMVMVFQRPLMLAATVAANVAFGLALRGRSEPERVRAVLDRLKLSLLANQPARTLSGGQMQLVALARAIVLEPEVLLLDEPTSNLDPARVAAVEEVLSDLNRERRTTIVWATHNLFQARRCGDRVVLLLDGMMVEASATETFFDSPRDRRTAAFVHGKMVY